MTTKLQNLTDEQIQELMALTTADDVLAFLERAGIELSEEVIGEMANGLSEDELEKAAGESQDFDDEERKTLEEWVRNIWKKINKY